MSTPKEMMSPEEWSKTWSHHGHTAEQIISAIQADVLEWCMCRFSFYCDAYKLIEQKHAELTKGKE